MRPSTTRHDHQEEDPTPAFGDLKLSANRGVALVGDSEVRLTFVEARLLALFLSNPRRLLRSELIYERVWGYDFGGRSNTLRVYVGYLRRKLEAGGRPRVIHTVRGLGYVLREP